MNIAKDPGLNELAASLREVVWINPLTAEELLDCQRLAQFNLNEAPIQLARKLVHPLPGCDNWALRICLGGAQRTLGVMSIRGTKSNPEPFEGLSVLFRFADMAQQYFWKYKLRGAQPPGDRDLNLGRSRLEADMVNEIHALALHEKME